MPSWQPESLHLLSSSYVTTLSHSSSRSRAQAASARTSHDGSDGHTNDASGTGTGSCDYFDHRDPGRRCHRDLGWQPECNGSFDSDLNTQPAIITYFYNFKFKLNFQEVITGIST
jgi:hypothetical protein